MNKLLVLYWRTFHPLNFNFMYKNLVNQFLDTTRKEWFELTEGLFLSISGGIAAVCLFEIICFFLGE